MSRLRKEPGQVAAAVPRPPWRAFRDELLKRGIDICAALVAIVFVSPLMMICALGIWGAYGAWPFDRRLCVGHHGRPFYLLTFRTGGKDGKGSEDRNSLGNVLTISNLDRLPEVFNLLRGDLSLVGPRPLSLQIHQYYAGRVPGYTQREQVKPGILGWAQLHEQGGVLDIRRQIELDIWYAKNPSLRLDFRILRLAFQRGLLGQD